MRPATCHLDKVLGNLTVCRGRGLGAGAAPPPPNPYPYKPNCKARAAFVKPCLSPYHLVILSGKKGVSRMKYGFVLPGGDARTAADFAHDAERAGWDGLFVCEA